MKKRIVALIVAIMMSAISITFYFYNIVESPISEQKENKIQDFLHDSPAEKQGMDDPSYTKTSISVNDEIKESSKVEGNVKTPFPVAAQAPGVKTFIERWKSSTYSVVHSRRSISKKGIDSLNFADRVDNVRENPNQTLIISYGPPYGWQIHRITESGFVKVEDSLPKNEDLQLYWISNRILLGVSVIYEQEMRPGMEDAFAKDTRLFIYDVDASEIRDVDMSSIQRESGTFFRIDAFSMEGFFKLSLVNPDQYFQDESIRDLGIFRISTE